MLQTRLYNAMLWCTAIMLVRVRSSMACLSRSACLDLERACFTWPSMRRECPPARCSRQPPACSSAQSLGDVYVMRGEFTDILSDFYYFFPMFGLGYFGTKHRDLHQLMFFMCTGGFCTVAAGLVCFLYFLELFDEPLNAEDAAACRIDPTDRPRVR